MKVTLSSISESPSLSSYVYTNSHAELTISSFADLASSSSSSSFLLLPYPSPPQFYCFDLFGFGFDLFGFDFDLFGFDTILLYRREFIPPQIN